MASVKRTMIAQQAFDFAGLFTIQFSRLKIAGACVRTPELLAPETDSTGGGKQALQHISLKPDVPGYPPVTVGSVNVAAKTGQLRTYACLYKMAQQRSRPFDIEQQSYQQFFDSARMFLGQQGFTVQIELEPPTAFVEKPVRPPSGVPRVVMWLLIAGMSLALIVALLVAAYVKFLR
ncbi:MAG: hypothetical protein KIT72_07960 [Polyangiaceae bacterium]|nr:hypothetical protein [Polyangiaceae bacterium]MCW5790340.1 hypothetical protein [Polyangiaceae bacterium]